MKRWLATCSFVALVGLLPSASLQAQGVTTGAMNVRVLNPNSAPLAGARVTAVHVPSGTSYTGSSRADGRAALAGLRVGGPYRVTAAAIGFEAQTKQDVYIALGVTEDVEFSLRQAVVTLEEVIVTATGEAVFSSQRTGAATTVPREALATLPSVTGQLSDFTRLTPQVRGTSFAGQDNRLNNITVDGSYFNNSFGLGGQPGDRTGVTPISIAAIQEVQVNIAPYDVRQGHFIGANVNTVTRSGTNELTGMLQYAFRQCSVDSTGACEKKFGLARMNGNQAGANKVSIGDFDFERYGGYVGGPIIKDKLFFFASYEHDGLSNPATTFRANTGNETPGGSITRVLQSDLDELRDFLSTNFNYDPGEYQGYPFDNPATRFIGKLDYNLNERNKISVRYNHLDSFTDQLVSNSSSLGFGTRRTVTTALNFLSSNYQIVENIRSVVGEWNSAIGSRFHNNLIIGYSHSDESRATGKSPPFDVADAGTWFPFVDILAAPSDQTVYTSFGLEPFTPNNELRYGTWQIQNNFTMFGEKHDWTFGVSGERFRSYNVFFQGAQSIYSYNSLQDFYTDANDYLANPNRTTSPVTLRRFQVAWANLPDPSCDGTNCPIGTPLSKPVQPLTAWYFGVYAQDEWRVNNRLRLTLGLRIDVPFFDSSGFVNPQANNLSFVDADGNQVRFRTQKLPDPNFQFSPRFGFNWNVDGKRNTQVRGGSGIMSGPPLYVWISNQIGNNGMLTGFQSLDNRTDRPFHPDPAHYKPATVTGAPASSYALAFTDPDFRFPQVWRSNIAVDQRLPWNIVGTAEFIYNRDINGIYYINANLRAPQSRYTGVDQRPRWFASCPVSGGGSGTCSRINNVVTSAIVLKNQSVGRAWNIGGSLERRWQSGFYAKLAYDYGEAKNTVDPGSIALGSWQNVPIVEDPNNPGLGNSFNWPGHRFFATVAYGRDWLKFGRTTVAAFFNAQTIGNTHYLFSGDANGDGNPNNDLIYIPTNADQMNFQAFTANAVLSKTGDTLTRRRVITSQEQRDAWEAYIQQDEYLGKHRGEYAKRGALILPLVKRVDFQISQDLHTLVGGKRNALQLRLDFLNFGNLLNNDWGISQRLVNNQPLLVSTSNSGSVIGCTGSFTGLADACGRLQYRLRTFQDPDPDGSGKNRYVLMGEGDRNRTFERTSFISDVWRLQVSLRYLFN